MVYVNGQDIARLVLGSLYGNRWLHAPESLEIRPEGYLLGLEMWLQKLNIDRADIMGFVLVKGPGSATALRTSHAMVNALAFALGVQVVSIEKEPQALDAEIVATLSEHAPHAFALPTYAHEPTITKTNRDALKRKV